MSPARRTLPALIAAALLVAACQGGEDPAPAAGGTEGATDAAETGGGEVAGSIFAFGVAYETGDEIAQVRIDRFRELHPDVEVTFSESGFDDQVFLSALAGGDPPDVVNIPRNTLGTYIARGVLAPLDDCIAQQDIDMGIFYEAGVNQVTVDGTPYALPEFFNSRVWMMNTPLFEEAGLDAATIDLSDWDAIAEANEQLTQLEGDRLTRIGIDAKLPEFLPLWSWANGAPMIGEDGLQANLDDPGVAEALAFSAGLHEPAGGRTTFLDFRDTWDFFGAENQFAADQLAAMPMEVWYLNVLAEASPDVELTVRPFQTREGEPITWADGNAWAIPTASDNVEAACAFISTMTQTDTWVAAAEVRAEQRAEEGLPNMGVYTGNREADEQIFGEIVDLAEWPRLEEAVQVVLEVQDHAFGLPPSPAAAQFEAAWTAAVTDVLTDGADPAERLAQAQETAQGDIDGAAR